LAEALLRLRKVRHMVIPGRPGIPLELPKNSAEILAAGGVKEAERHPTGGRK
jgi:hypothetical protein